MFKHHSDGGSQRPPRTSNNFKILLIGSRMSDGDEIRRELGIIPGFNYTTWYCSDLDDALDFLAAPDSLIDLIFLDLSLFNADYPKEYFLEVKKAIPETPIVVLTDRTDFDLIDFVMAGGAAENISQWQLRNDPDRLRGLVESCCARDRISKAAQAVTAAELKDEKDTAAIKLKRAQSQGAEFLSAMQRKYEADTIDLMAENKLLKAKKTTDEVASGKKLQHAEDALGRSEAELQALQASVAAATTQNNAASSASLTRLSDENIQLRKDIGLHAISIKVLEKQHAASIADINTKSDAVLQYAEKKGALEIKKVKEENAQLRNENKHARDWMSGSYSGAPTPETPAVAETTVKPDNDDPA